MDGSGRGCQPPRFLSHTQCKPHEQARSVPVCRWAICGAPLAVPGLANPGPTQILLHQPSGQPHPLVSPFGCSLWTVSVFESHPLNFIFLRGHLKVSSCRDKAPQVGLLFCACGPWWEVVPHSRLPEAPIVLASIFSASSIHLCQSDPGLWLQICLLELNTWLQACVVGVRISSRALVMFFEPPQGIHIHRREPHGAGKASCLEYSQELRSAKSLSRVRLFATPGTVARQAPLSMGFSRQEYWSGLPCPPPGDLPWS